MTIIPAFGRWRQEDQGFQAKFLTELRVLIPLGMIPVT